uniref:Uncharacterized protein n=1 Tax=Lepeophtheirus salmonis TaxID=72036 RepID=A0A0K2T9K9_LEPSM
MCQYHLKLKVYVNKLRISMWKKLIINVYKAFWAHLERGIEANVTLIFARFEPVGFFFVGHFGK